MMSRKLSLLGLSILINMLTRLHLISASHHYQIIHHKKKMQELACSDHKDKKHMVQIPAFDSQTDQSIGSTVILLSTLQVQHIEHIINGRIDRTTEYPVACKYTTEDPTTKKIDTHFKVIWLSADRAQCLPFLPEKSSRSIMHMLTRLWSF
jgi:hypothetical protein